MFIKMRTRRLKLPGSLPMIHRMGAVFVNAFAIVLGSVIGLLFGKRINASLQSVIMYAAGTVVLVLGIQMSLEIPNTLVALFALAIGGIIGVCAILIRKELLLPILCGVFFVESLSVIIQRFYFKYTKRKYGAGRRVFKMTPLHHHFQKEGIPAIITAPAKALPEAKIVTRFWIIGIILAVLTIALLKIR